MRSTRAPGTGDGEGITKQELLETSKLSSKTFDMIRKASRVRGPSHGGLTWVFSFDDVITLIRTAEGGRFTERGGAPAQAWREMLSERGIVIED
jgi:hypothetical protein